MKVWQVLMMVLVTWAVMYGAIRLADLKSNAIREDHHHKICLDARVEFFNECLSTTSRPECEVMWAQLRGHVFRGDPRMGLFDEVDCSEEVR